MYLSLSLCVCVLQELLTSLGSRQWRVREASCLALADLVPQRSLDQVRRHMHTDTHARRCTCIGCLTSVSGVQVERHIEPLWTMTFRALDDIKESVRSGAFAFHSIYIESYIVTILMNDNFLHCLNFSYLWVVFRCILTIERCFCVCLSLSVCVCRSRQQCVRGSR